MIEKYTWPSYKKLLKNNSFQERIDKAYKILESCNLCPRNCHINRLKGRKGYCGGDDRMIVSSYGPHYGEESPLVGTGGSGTIFLANCNLKCIFCQNYDISHEERGQEKSPEELAMIMKGLQEEGCLNINFVTPTHYLPYIIEGIKIAGENGLNLPIVWNCGGYESPEIIKLLEDIVDIYMPDFKFYDDNVASKMINTKDYFLMAGESLKEMHRQVGDLLIEKGIAKRGILIRHLVMPENMAGTKEVMKFIAGISKNSYVNIMDQYRPCYKAHNMSEINRRITPSEYRKAVEDAKEAGITRLDRKEDRYGWLNILIDGDYED